MLSRLKDTVRVLAREGNDFKFSRTTTGTLPTYSMSIFKVYLRFAAIFRRQEIKSRSLNSQKRLQSSLHIN